MKSSSFRAVASLSILFSVALAFQPNFLFGQGMGRKVEQKSLPYGKDVFDLTLSETEAFSSLKNFEVVGHSYFKGPWLTRFARQNGLGAGFNTPRIHKGIAFLGGYDSPSTLFGILIADVSNPKNMTALSFIPCNPGTRCPYVRLNTSRQILVATQDTRASNPAQPPPGEPVRAGISFHDVSDPRDPQPLAFFLTRDTGRTHGFEIDDSFVYACANTPDSKVGVPGGNQELLIIDYRDSASPTLASSLHIEGQHQEEEFEERDRFNPDGTEQKVWCHEITLHKKRLYIAWRDAGMVIVDVSDPFDPTIISRLDYVPPFSGGSIGAAHTSAPVVADPDEHPSLLVLTDEIFDCPPGFGRVVDISDLSNPQVVSSYRIPHVGDDFNSMAGEFRCPPGEQSAHLPWFDFRAPSLLYQAWYDQGVRVWDISNPFLPREVGFYLSPRYAAPGRADRHTREVFQDPDTELLFVTDGSGGGLTVLRWVGPIPKGDPIPAAR